MSQNFLYNASFHLFLNQIDQEIANNIREEGCPHCQGKLHQADYPRSPLGIPALFREHYDSHLGFCCADCRKRVTPTSVRFFGRRWYPAPLVLLISLLTLGINARRLEQIKRHFGLVVSESTWRRWRRWWRESFTQTQFWQQAKGLLPPTPQILRGPFPRVLLMVYPGNVEDRLYRLLAFFSPLTAGRLRAV